MDRRCVWAPTAVSRLRREPSRRIALPDEWSCVATFGSRSCTTDSKQSRSPLPAPSSPEWRQKRPGRTPDAIASLVSRYSARMGVEPVHDNIRVLQPLYFAAMLEELKVF